VCCYYGYMKHYLETHPRVFGVIGSGVSLIIAVTYYIFVPPEAAGTSGLQQFILLYAHPLVWVFMAAASALFALQKFAQARTVFMYAALALYAAFITILLATKLL
jgi:hypothetical protein